MAGWHSSNSCGRSFPGSRPLRPWRNTGLPSCILSRIPPPSVRCRRAASRGALLFSAQRGELCFLAVDPAFRRRGIGRGLFSFLLSRMEEGRDISLITYPADDPNGQAARAFYRHLGFSAGRMTCAFGHPAQEFILRRGGR